MSRTRTLGETLRIPKAVTGLDANLFVHTEREFTSRNGVGGPVALGFSGPPDTLLSAIIDEINEVSESPSIGRVLDNLRAWSCIYPSLTKTFGAMGKAATELLASEEERRGIQ